MRKTKRKLGVRDLMWKSVKLTMFSIFTCRQILDTCCIIAWLMDTGSAMSLCIVRPWCEFSWSRWIELYWTKYHVHLINQASCTPRKNNLWRDVTIHFDMYRDQLSAKVQQYYNNLRKSDAPWRGGGRKERIDDVNVHWWLVGYIKLVLALPINTHAANCNSGLSYYT